jgi:hypothetical protein
MLSVCNPPHLCPMRRLGHGVAGVWGGAILGSPAVSNPGCGQKMHMAQSSPSVAACILTLVQQLRLHRRACPLQAPAIGQVMACHIRLHTYCCGHRAGCCCCSCSLLRPYRVLMGHRLTLHAAARRGCISIHRLCFSSGLCSRCLCLYCRCRGRGDLGHNLHVSMSKEAQRTPEDKRANAPLDHS